MVVTQGGCDVNNSKRGDGVKDKGAQPHLDTEGGAMQRSSSLSENVEQQQQSPWSKNKEGEPANQNMVSSSSNRLEIESREVGRNPASPMQNTIDGFTVVQHHQHVRGNTFHVAHSSSHVQPILNRYDQLRFLNKRRNGYQKIQIITF